MKTKHEYLKASDAADVICIQCLEYIDENGDADSSVCDACPVRKTLDRMRR